MTEKSSSAPRVRRVVSWWYSMSWAPDTRRWIVWRNESERATGPAWVTAVPLGRYRLRLLAALRLWRLQRWGR